MVKRKTTMNVGTYKTRKQALSAASNFRKGSKMDISNRYSVSYRVEKAGKNTKNYKVVSTLKPKKMKKSSSKPKTMKKKSNQWISFSDPRTLRLKDSEIAKGKIVFDSKNYRWRRK